MWGIILLMGLVFWMAGICGLMHAPPITSLEAYRTHVFETPGDSARGRVVFQRQNIGCTVCHTVGGENLKAGPDLQGIADKYSRDELIRAVLEPSAAILTGYATRAIVTDSGGVHSGIVVRRDPDEIELLLATNRRVRIALDKTVEEAHSETSLMPAGVHKLLTPQEFSDLISYLATLTQPVSKGFSGLEVPESIRRLERPIELEAFHSEEYRFQKPIWFEPFPGTTNRFVVLQHDPPEIWTLEKRASGDEKSLFLALGNEADAGKFTDSMGMAFHPDFLTNRKYYIYHHVRTQGHKVRSS